MNNSCSVKRWLTFDFTHICKTNKMSQNMTKYLSLCFDRPTPPPPPKKKKKKIPKFPGKLSSSTESRWLKTVSCITLTLYLVCHSKLFQFSSK